MENGELNLNDRLEITYREVKKDDEKEKRNLHEEEQRLQEQAGILHG